MGAGSGDQPPRPTQGLGLESSLHPGIHRPLSSGFRACGSLCPLRYSVLQKLFPPIPHMKDPTIDNLQSSKLVRPGFWWGGGSGTGWPQPRPGSRILVCGPWREAGESSPHGAPPGSQGLEPQRPACPGLARPLRLSGRWRGTLVGESAALPGPVVPRRWPGRPAEQAGRTARWRKCRFWEKHDAGPDRLLGMARCLHSLVALGPTDDCMGVCGGRGTPRAHSVELPR